MLANYPLILFESGSNTRRAIDEFFVDRQIEGVVSNRKLAKRLDLSENTVKFHVRNILDKLPLHNRAEAVGYALRKRIDPTA